MQHPLLGPEPNFMTAVRQVADMPLLECGILEYHQLLLHRDTYRHSSNSRGFWNDSVDETQRRDAIQHPAS
jgi:hypothetical protein